MVILPLIGCRETEIKLGTTYSAKAKEELEVEGETANGQMMKTQNNLFHFPSHLFVGIKEAGTKTFEHMRNVYFSVTFCFGYI